MTCSDSLLTDNSSAYHYFAKSGDAGGVDITTDGEGVKTYKYVCQDGWEHSWDDKLVGMRLELSQAVRLITIKDTMFEEQLSRTATFGCPVPVEVI